MPDDTADSNAAIVLRRGLAKAREHGHEYVQLVVRKRANYSPRNWDRVRVISGKPSLMGRLVGQQDNGLWLFDVTVVAVEAWLYLKGVRNA